MKVNPSSDFENRPIPPWDQDRQPTLVATGVVSLAGQAHTRPPCWPGSQPFMGINLVTVTHEPFIGGMTVAVENFHDPYAISVETAAGLIGALMIAAERMGLKDKLVSFVDQIVVGGRDWLDEHPEVDRVVYTHDPATCNCPPYDGEGQ